MRFGTIGLVLLGLAVGCGDGAGPGNDVMSDIRAGRRPGTAALEGLVFTIPPGDDSVRIPVPGAVVTLARVGDLPVDTFPGDTMLWFRGLALVALFDTVPGPGDTITPPPPYTSTPPPPDTAPPPDTVVPPDTTPPPSLCQSGEVVVQVTTSSGGRYRVPRLQPGIYRVAVEPPPASGLGARELCPVLVRPARPTPLDVLLWTLPGPDPIPGDST